MEGPRGNRLAVWGSWSAWFCLRHLLKGVPPQSSQPVPPVRMAQRTLSRGGRPERGKGVAILNSDSATLQPIAVYGPRPTCLKSSQTLRSMLPEREFPPLQSGIPSIYLAGLLGVCETVGTHA